MAGALNSSKWRQRCWLSKMAAVRLAHYVSGSVASHCAVCGLSSQRIRAPGSEPNAPNVRRSARLQGTAASPFAAQH